jgi:hypothetical protein
MRSPPGCLVGPRRPHHGIAAIVAAAKKQGRHASGNHLRMASGGPMHHYFVGSVRGDRIAHRLPSGWAAGLLRRTQC